MTPAATARSSSQSWHGAYSNPICYECNRICPTGSQFDSDRYAPAGVCVENRKFCSLKCTRDYLTVKCNVSSAFIVERHFNEIHGDSAAESARFEAARAAAADEKQASDYHSEGASSSSHKAPVLHTPVLHPCSPALQVPGHPPKARPTALIDTGTATSVIGAAAVA